MTDGADIGTTVSSRLNGAVMQKGELMSDLIDRQAAINAIPHKTKGMGGESWMMTYRRSGHNDCVDACLDAIRHLPSAQLDRDIPKKPGETTDRAWGIPHRQAVCPTCDSYLGIIHFISKDAKLKISYCESCGQAIDWEGWEEDE